MNWASVVAPSDAGIQVLAAAFSGVGKQVLAAAFSGAANRTLTVASPDAVHWTADVAQPVCCSAEFAAGQDTDKLFYSELLLQRKDSHSEKLLE